ncbi:MAG: hypothetical protein ACFCGT_12935 [Sandaracinaceae bacterium]
MAHLEVDFAVPLALLAGSLIGVLVLRLLASRSRHRAARRTRRLVERLGMGGRGEAAGP